MLAVVRLDASEGDRFPNVVQLPDQRLDARAGILSEPSQALLESRVGRIDEVTKDVGIPPLRLGVELRGRDHPEAELWAGRDRLGDAGERVVVGERKDP